MKKRVCNRENLKDPSGEVVLEAMILVIIIVYAIFFTINVACIYYNRITVASVAQEAASGSAAVYNSEAREPFVGYVSPTYFEGRDVYRYFGISEPAMNVETQKKAKWYGSYLLYKNEFATSQNHQKGLSDHIETTCEKNNKLGCTVVHVSIEKEYPLFIANPMRYFGIDPKYTCTAVGTAVCYDPLHQMNLMALMDEFLKGVNGAFTVTNRLNGTEEKTGQAIGSTMDAVSKVTSLIEKIKGLFS